MEHSQPNSTFIQTSPLYSMFLMGFNIYLVSNVHLNRTCFKGKFRWAFKYHNPLVFCLIIPKALLGMVTAWNDLLYSNFTLVQERLKWFFN